MTAPKPQPLPTQDWPNDIVDPVYFTNSQWAVTGFGLERIDEGQPYEVAAGHLAFALTDPKAPPTSAVLEQIGPKTWVDPAKLFDAFRKALAIHHPGAELAFDIDQDERQILEMRSRRE